MVLIVSQISVEESLVPIHLHKLEQALGYGQRSTPFQILGAQLRSLVILFDNDAGRDRTLADIWQARFDFLEEKNVKLEATRLSKDTALNTRFILAPPH